MINNFLDEHDQLDLRKISHYVNLARYEDVNDMMNMKIRDKYRIISLFVDPKHRKTIKSQEKNHSTLKKDKMTYLVSEAFIKLFLSVCKLYANPIQIKPEDQTRMNPGAFRRLIQGVDEDMEILEEKIERLESKNLKGYMLTSDHNKIADQWKDDKREYQDKITKLERKLEDLEKYYKEKLEKVNERHQKTQKHLSKQIQDQSKIDQSTSAKADVKEREIVNYDTDDSTD